LPSFSPQSLELLNNAGLAQRLRQSEDQLFKDWRKFAKWLVDDLRNRAPSLMKWSPPKLAVGKDDDGVEYVSVCIGAGSPWKDAGVRLYFSVFANSFWDEGYYPNVGLAMDEEWEHRDAFRAFIADHIPAGFVSECGDGSPDPDCLLWKNIPLQRFERNGVFNLDDFVKAIAKAFDELAAVKPHIDSFLAEKHPVRSAVPPIGRAIIFDLEGYDEIVEVALIPVAYDSETGDLLGQFGPPYEGLRDPGSNTKLPAKITRAMVAGKKLDENAINALIAQADVVVAHNVSYDRPRFVSLFPSADALTWLCSLNDLGWKAYGFEETNLEYICAHLGVKNRNPHKALPDAEGVLEVLAKPYGSGTYFSELLKAKGISKQGHARPQALEQRADALCDLCELCERRPLTCQYQSTTRPLSPPNQPFAFRSRQIAIALAQR
jgi:hypothetical protein